MISVQSIVDRLQFVLDAENSDRYTFDNDYGKAINSSVEWLSSVFNKAFADKKLSEEDLRDLIKVVVFQTSEYSRVNLSLMDDSVWSIMRVNPEPEVIPGNSEILPVQSPDQSVWRNDLSYRKSKFSAKKLTLEQWEDNVENIFEAGNERMLNSFKSYAYLNWANYTSDQSSFSSSEIEIRPEIPNALVAITYLKYPTPVQSITDSIEFPESLTNLVFEKAANFISWKQGDQTNLYTVTERDVLNLIQSMI